MIQPTELLGCLSSRPLSSCRLQAALKLLELQPAPSTAAAAADRQGSLSLLRLSLARSLLASGRPREAATCLELSLLTLPSYDLLTGCNASAAGSGSSGETEAMRDQQQGSSGSGETDPSRRVCSAIPRRKPPALTDIVSVLAGNAIWPTHMM